MIESISLQEMRRLHEIANYSGKRSEMDYVYVHVTPDGDVDAVRELQRAIRFNGMIITLVVGGQMNLTVNMEYYKLSRNSMFVTGPNSIISVDNESIKNLEAYVLFVSTDFLRDLNFEIVVLNSMPLGMRSGPCTMLTETEVKMLSSYLDLLDANARHNEIPGDEHLVKSISRTLLTATFYQLMVIGMKRRSDAEDEAAHKPRSRRMIYTHEFVRLVRKHFRYERSVAFYAGKLCMSAKYLSLVVKDCTGHSAAEIIDDHVILEAKNLLRFSGKNIQQVAYELNFSNQSSFGKYFKHLTGMSPSEFQNS